MSSDKSPHPEHSKSRPIWACAALAPSRLFVACLIILQLGYHLYKRHSTVASGITWWPCPDITTTQCAYLSVPRDYVTPGDTVSVFLRKVPATVPRNMYLGSILINPGGPGGSGSKTAATLGPKLSAIVDGRYDIIGFDPRGVNMTVPKLGCYANQAQAVHSTYKQTLLGLPYDARGSDSLPVDTRAHMEHAYLKRLNASFTTTSLACFENGNKPMLESVSTAFVVQDMERIVDALGQDGLHFWGFSYGTILGSTFAAMRPHLVKRMVLDGVSNAETYHKDMYQWGIDGLTDTQKTLDGFFDACAQAGPERCAFAQSPTGKVGTNGTELHARLEALYSRLRDEPVPVPKSSTGPGILTASDLKRVIFNGLYSPKVWPEVAMAIAQAEAGNPQLVYDREYNDFETIKPSNGNENAFNRYMEHQSSAVTTSAIMCSDSEKPAPKSLDEYADYIHTLGKLAPIGEIWAMWTGFCASWKIRPGQRYDGPWTVEEGLQTTRFPILYASLDADPVTPLSAAQKMVQSFGNQSAALLVQEGFGHCTVAHPSLCTAKAIRDYFLEGKVPAPGMLDILNTMVVLSSFTSLLALAASVHARPYHPEGVLKTEALGEFPLPALVPRHGELEARGRHHHHQHHHHHKHKHHNRDVEDLDLAKDEDATDLRIPQKRHVGHSLDRQKRKDHHRTKVYADDPVVISGDHNHVHTHTHGGHRHGHHGHGHGHHRHHGHGHGHGTKVYADDPLIVSGNGNHVHSHSHKKRFGVCEDDNLLEMSHRPVSGMLFDPTWNGFQHSVPVDLRRDLNSESRMKRRGHPLDLARRGLMDSLVPLLAPIPGIAGVIDIVGSLSHVVLSNTLASLIISSKPTAGAMGIQSAEGEQLPGYSINASNSTSTTMYLVPQDGVQANLGPKEKPVLVTMPMLQTKDNTVKLYCASYDPNSASPSQLSSQPCVYNPNAGLDTNGTSTRMSQLFAWNIEDGSISPLWTKQEGSSQVEAASAPSGNSDPGHVGGYVIGGAPSVNVADAGRSAPSQFSMVFRTHPAMSSESDSSTESTILASDASSDEESQPPQPVDGDLDDQDASLGSDDEQGSPIVAGANDESSQEEGATMAQDEPTSSSSIDQSATPLATSGPTSTAMQAEIVTSTFTMLVAPTQSLDAAAATDSTTSVAPSSTMM
ncbi:unnamed protein product [Rhizoctonia solani]|nr:unnamed protein product [Rhizoctonia solani]